MSSTTTQRWLRQNVQLYSQKDHVYSHIDAALIRFSTLRPKSDVYIFDDGRSQLLLCLHGLLPISFRGASYNIPIAVWLTRDYPRDPPIVYVIPTTDMLIKAGKYIDVSGRCNIEYIQLWARKNEACNLSALLEAMQHQFSREPPLYAKPSNLPSTGHPRNYQSKPPPPLPSPVNVSSTPPALPPKPLLPAYLPSVDIRSPAQQPSGRHVSVGLDIPHNSFAEQVASLEPHPPPPPPLPPLPHTAPDIRPPQYRSPHIEPPAAPTSSSTVVSHAPVSRFAPLDVVEGPPLDSAATALFHSSRAGSLALPSYQSQVRGPQQETERPSIYPNLLDEDSLDTPPPVPPQNPSMPPPPRPPNPETLRLHAAVHQKLVSELSSLSEALATDADRLRAHQTDLLNGEPAIRDEMARLEAVRTVCSTVANRMKGLISQAESNITELRRKGDPEVDELVCSTTIVHNQLVTLIAEDNAIEDTIYHLHRALNAGRIDLERFLRSTRLLAEEQFMKRALIEKIQAGMPMGWSMGSDWS